MLIPNDNPFFSPVRKQGVENRRSAWFYPATPIIVANVTDEEFDSMMKNRNEEFVIAHEKYHVWQIKTILPFNVILLDIVTDVLLQREIPLAHIEDKKARASKIFSQWSAFLEGSNILHSLWMYKKFEYIQKRLLASLFEAGNEVHLEGVRMIIGENRIDEKLIIDFVTNVNICDLILRLKYIIDMAPFIKNRKLNLLKVYNDNEVARMAESAAEVVFNEHKLLRLEEKARRIEYHGKIAWSQLFDVFNLVIPELDKKEALVNIYEQLIVPTGLVVVPVALRDGCACIAVTLGPISKEDEERFRPSDANAWLDYACQLEAKSSDSSFVCPLYRLTEGARTGFCLTEPNAEKCSVGGPWDSNIVIDISARAPECSLYWTVILRALCKHFGTVLNSKNLLLIPNKIVFRTQTSRLMFGNKVRVYCLKAKGGWFTFDWVPCTNHDVEEIEGISKKEAFEVVDRLPVDFSTKDTLFRPWKDVSEDSILIVEIDEEGNDVICLDEEEYFFLTLLRHLESVGNRPKKAYSSARHFLNKRLGRDFLPRKKRKKVFKTWRRMRGKKMKCLRTQEDLLSHFSIIAKRIKIAKKGSSKDLLAELSDYNYG